MIHKTKKTITCLLLLVSGSTCIAQTSLGVTSNSNTHNGITYEYVIGEMTLVTTDKIPNLIVTQGFLQPNTVHSPSDIDADDLAPFLQVYPNPTEDIVFIDIKNDMLNNLTYNLYDVSGRVLLTGKAEGKNLLPINLKSYSTGNYYLILSASPSGKPQNYSFKIQKK